MKTSLTTYTIAKVPLSIYHDYFIKGNKCYLFQETQDDRVHTKFVCNTTKECIDNLTEDQSNIYITI